MAFFFFFNRNQRHIMCFYQIAEKAVDLICFYDSRNGLFSQGPEAIFISLARQGGGSPLCPIRRAEAKPMKPLAGPHKNCVATYFYKSIPFRDALFFCFMWGKKFIFAPRIE
jgi:hypothetical protein